MGSEKKISGVVALDLDGTALNSQSHFSEGVKRMLDELIGRGIHVVVASGRSFWTLPEEVLAYPGLEYAITSNGAAIYHIPSRTKLHGFVLKEQAVRQILALTKDRPIVYEAFVDGHAYADERYIADPGRYGAGEHAVAYVRRTRTLCRDMNAFFLEHVGELDSIDIVTGDPDLKREIVLQLKQEVEGIYITSSVPQLIEISDERAGKSAALRFILDQEKIPVECTAAFGNADNDIDMIRFAKYGFAVENATESCKEAADYIVASNDEDGVASGMLRFMKFLEQEG